MRYLAALMSLAFVSMAQSPAPDAACGARDARFEVTKDKTQHPTATPADGKALIYLIGEARGTATLAVDGKPVDAVSNSYSYLEIDPGKHHLCALFRGFPLDTRISLHSLEAKAGEVYYFGVVYYRFPTRLELLDPDEAKYQISQLSYSRSQPKSQLARTAPVE